MQLDNPHAAHELLQRVQAGLRLVHGSLDQELTGQLLVTAFLPRDACVLELGGNVGRVSCVVNSLLHDRSRHVVLEIDPATADRLAENRDANGLAFRVEAAALGGRPLLMEVTDDSLGRRSAVAGLESRDRDWWPARRISWPDLCAKHPGLHFDALVCDCEGALFDICSEYPGFLGGFHTIVSRSDYGCDEKKRAMDALFEAEGLVRVACVPVTQSPKTRCEAEFYEVWRRPTRRPTSP